MKNLKWIRRMIGGTWYRHNWTSWTYDSSVGAIEQDEVAWDRNPQNKEDETSAGKEVYPEYKSFTCWFSWNIWDIHDYPKSKGGDGEPKHFYTYNCHMCEKEFTI